MSVQWHGSDNHDESSSATRTIERKRVVLHCPLETKEHTIGAIAGGRVQGRGKLHARLAIIVKRGGLRSHSTPGASREDREREKKRGTSAPEEQIRKRGGSTLDHATTVMREGGVKRRNREKKGAA